MYVIDLNLDRLSMVDFCASVIIKYNLNNIYLLQVSCMEDICGMLPFYTPDAPDQFYRIITANFLHAG